MEIQEENSVLMMPSLVVNNAEDQISLSDEKNQLQNNREDETQLIKSFNDLLLQLNLRLVDKDQLLEKYRNENKLLKGRLKGYETLSSLYEQSRLVNSQLRKQCDEQRILLEQQQQQADGLFPLNVHSSEIPRGAGATLSEAPERHFWSFEMIESSSSDQNTLSSHVESARPPPNDFKENSICQMEEFGKAGRADEEVEKPPKASEPLSEIPFVKCAVDDGCGTDKERSRCLKQNEAESGPFEIMELNVFERYLKDVHSSNESKDLLMELLSVGMKIIDLENQFSEDDEDQEYHSSTAKVGVHRLCEQLSSCLKSGSSNEVSTLDEATQTRDVATGPSRNPERKVAVTVSLANSSTKPLLSGDVGCLLNEIQILQSQALTFKDDFERERKDLERIRSKYESMKKQYTRLTAEYAVHKGQLRDLQLRQAKKKEATMNQHMSTAAAKLGAFQPSVGMCRLQPIPVSPPKWTCVRCTFENSNAGKICEMCQLDRSRLRKKGR